MPRAAALILCLLAALGAAPPVVPTRPSRVTVCGMVLDERGKAVPGATVVGMVTVSAGRKLSCIPLAEQRTDSEGAFRFEVNRSKGTASIQLRAWQGQAFMAGLLEVADRELGRPVTLLISPANGRGLRVRAVDEDGKPVSGARITVRSQPTMRTLTPTVLEVKIPWPPGKESLTDASGRLESPRCLPCDGRYQLEILATGYQRVRTPWRPATAAGPVAFGDVVLRRVRVIQGRVVDWQGKPVARARVLRLDGSRRLETRTDSDGRFTLKTAFSPLGLLFVEREGFRFHGQRCQREDRPVVTLTRHSEPVKVRMKTLPRAGSRQQRRRLAAQLLRPILDQLSRMVSDDERIRPLELLAEVDAGRLLQELERRPVRSDWFDGYLRRAAVKALQVDSREEARTIADSVRDPDFRATCYVDLADGVPQEESRAERLALLNQALVHSRAVLANDHRILHLAGIARRLWALGEKERARKLLREGQAIARELPTAGWAGYARGAFAEDLALIDRPAALELMKGLKDPYEFVRHHANLAAKLAGSQPTEAERLLELIRKQKSRQEAENGLTGRICAFMVPVDGKRARKLADLIQDRVERARALGAMAEALVKSRPSEARKLLDAAFVLLAQEVAAGRDASAPPSQAAVAAGVMLPTVEALDPTLLPEYFWRVLAWRVAAGGTEASSIGGLALVAARYDRVLAAALVDEARQQPRPNDHHQAVDLQAAVLIDPKRAVALAEKLPATSNGIYIRSRLIRLLLAEGKDLEREVFNALGLWSVDDEE